MERADLVIVGGGAAGLTAAIFAAEASEFARQAARRIVVLDGAKTLGAKILVAGGGRCNVTHEVVTPGDFNGSQNIVKNVLAAFDAAAAVKWFEALGVKLKREETGKLFPVADSARVVLNALLSRCRDLGVILQTSSKVTQILPPRASADSAPATPEAELQATPRIDRKDAPDLFTITHENGAIRARKVIVCTGGKSLPRSGSDGSGWEILKSLGHTVTATYAALVPLVLLPQMFHAELAGISMEVELSVFADGKKIDQRTGSLLWTHFGISGPVAMDASRHWTTARESGQAARLVCNLWPGESFERAESGWMKAAAARPRAAVLTLLSERLVERMAAAVIRHVGIDPAMAAGQLSREGRRALMRGITGLELPVSQHRGWNYAEVTAGGVPLREIDFRTMESRKVAGLFLAGEVLDCDGRIGGFNFQWAWATGFLAGKAAGEG